MTLSERHRPATLRDVVGQPKAVKVLERITADGIGGRAYYFSGPSSSGKTTFARILGKGIVSNGFDLVETVARDMTPAYLKDIKRRWVFAGGHCLIVNESHGLSRAMIEIFLDVLENLQPNVAVIFTTTNEGLDLFEDKVDSGPFASRCVNIKLTPRGLVTNGTIDGKKQPGAFTIRAHEIATKENLNGRPIADYIKLLTDCKGNLRLALSRIEQGCMMED